MKRIHKSYKFRIYPNEDQSVLLNKHFGSVRFIYNYFLNQRKENYIINKKSYNYYEQCKFLTELKKEEDFIWLNEINSQTLQSTLKHLEESYNSFFKKKTGFPKFKNKRTRNSFIVPQYVRLEDSKLLIPKFKTPIKIKQDREIKGTIKHCSLSKEPSGKFFVSIIVEEDYIPYKSNTNNIGLDLGIKHLVVDSTGKKYKNNKYTKKYQRKLKRHQQHLSRKKKGSRRFENQKLKVSKIHEKIRNSRNDILNKISTQIIKQNNIICIEDLNIKGMIKNKNLSKHIQDSSWGEFIRKLEYKSNWNNRTLVKVNRFFPSSKTCNECGYIHQSLKLDERTWTCKNNHKLDRDINASINILKEGLRLLNVSSVGTTDYTNGELVKLKLFNNNNVDSVKLETSLL